MPAGKNAGHALPRQDAREQLAGATLAGRAPPTTVGGGGAAILRGGGGRATLWEGPPVGDILETSPAADGGRNAL